MFHLTHAPNNISWIEHQDALKKCALLDAKQRLVFMRNYFTAQGLSHYAKRVTTSKIKYALQRMNHINSQNSESGQKRKHAVVSSSSSPPPSQSNSPSEIEDVTVDEDEEEEEEKDGRFHKKARVQLDLTKEGTEGFLPYDTICVPGVPRMLVSYRRMLDPAQVVRYVMVLCVPKVKSMSCQVKADETDHQALHIICTHTRWSYPPTSLDMDQRIRFFKYIHQDATRWDEEFSSIYPQNDGPPFKQHVQYRLPDHLQVDLYNDSYIEAFPGEKGSRFNMFCVKLVGVTQATPPLRSCIIED